MFCNVFWIENNKHQQLQQQYESIYTRRKSFEIRGVIWLLVDIDLDLLNKIYFSFNYLYYRELIIFRILQYVLNGFTNIISFVEYFSCWLEKTIVTHFYSIFRYFLTLFNTKLTLNCNISILINKINWMHTFYVFYFSLKSFKLLKLSQKSPNAINLCKHLKIHPVKCQGDLDGNHMVMTLTMNVYYIDVLLKQ